MELNQIKFESYLKTSFIDFPDLISSVAYFGSCNFKCPYCHNGDLVSCVENKVDAVDWLDYLKERRGLIDGVVISGGEPSMWQSVMPLVREVKKLSMKVKVDTNGSNPDWIEALLNEGALDYIAMDLKNSPKKYEMTVGLDLVDKQALYKSIDLIVKSGIPHEFRTTLTKEFHEIEDLVEMATLINGSRRYVLQQYQHSPKQLVSTEYTAYTVEEMNRMKDQIQPLLQSTHIHVIGKY